jgi:hypothetical protein
VIYADKNADDPFHFSLDFAHVGERVLAPPNDQAGQISAQT